MSSSSSKSSGAGNMLVQGIRYGVGYIERFLKNAKSQALWTFAKCKWAYAGLLALHTRKIGAPYEVTKFFLGMLLCIGGGYLLFFLLIWAAIKSI